MPEVVIVAASRSPVGRTRKGSLSAMRSDDLAAQLVPAVPDQVPARNPLFAETGERTNTTAKPDADGWTDPRDLGKLPDVYIAMGQTAENVARARGITHEEMDRFGVRSQNLAERMF